MATGAVALAHRCDELSTQLRQLAHTEDTHKRALEYVERVCVIGIGKLVASMDTDRRQRFFSGAIKSLTLDGKGRGVWRKRWVQSYELTDPLGYIYLATCIGLRVKNLYVRPCPNPHTSASRMIIATPICLPG